MSNAELTSIRDGLDGARNDKSILNLSKFPEFHNELTSNLDWDLSATTKEIRENHLKLLNQKWYEMSWIAPHLKMEVKSHLPKSGEIDHENDND